MVIRNIDRIVGFQIAQDQFGNIRLDIPDDRAGNIKIKVPGTGSAVVAHTKGEDIRILYGTPVTGKGNHPFSGRTPEIKCIFYAGKIVIIKMSFLGPDTPE